MAVPVTEIGKQGEDKFVMENQEFCEEYETWVGESGIPE